MVGREDARRRIVVGAGGVQAPTDRDQGVCRVLVGRFGRRLSLTGSAQSVVDGLDVPWYRAAVGGGSKSGSWSRDAPQKTPPSAPSGADAHAPHAPRNVQRDQNHRADPPIPVPLDQPSPVAVIGLAGDHEPPPMAGPAVDPALEAEPVTLGPAASTGHQPGGSDRAVLADPLGSPVAEGPRADVGEGAV